MIGSDDILQVSLVPASVQITDTGFSVQITVDNTSQQKVKVRKVLSIKCKIAKKICNNFKLCSFINSCKTHYLIIQLDKFK